jgi:hypothetical protein
VFVVAITSLLASVVPRKFPVDPFHGVVPLLPTNDQALVEISDEGSVHTNPPVVI